MINEGKLRLFEEEIPSLEINEGKLQEILRKGEQKFDRKVLMINSKRNDRINNGQGLECE